MTDEGIRFEIGFKGGGTTGGELPPDQLARLEASLGAGGSGGLVELAGDGSHWWIRVEDISWVRRGERDRKLGFGTS
jgi:hypothetical protein